MHYSKYHIYRKFHEYIPPIIIPSRTKSCGMTVLICMELVMAMPFGDINANEGIETLW